MPSFSSRLMLPNDPQPRLREEMVKAIVINDVDALKNLVKEGLDTKAFDDSGHSTARSTPLMTAAKWGKPDCVRFLIPFSDVNAQKPRAHTTALIHAVLCVDAEAGLACVETMLPHANPNLQGPMGFTALMFAAKMHQPKMVEALLRVSDLRIATEKGTTAFDVALQEGDSECVDRVAQTETAENINKRREIVETLFKAAGPEKMPRWAARLEAEAIQAALSGAENDEAALQKLAPQRRTKSL